jgi:hypothetical protein
MEEYKIKIVSILSDIDKYLPVLNKYNYKKETETIYLTHLHELFDLQRELKELELDTTFYPMLLISNGEISIYDDYIE